MLACALGLRGGGVATPQKMMRARHSVAVAEQLRDGEAAAKVVYGKRRILARKLQKAVDALRLTRDGEVGRGGLSLFRNPREEFGRLFGLTSKQTRLGQQRASVADAAMVAHRLGQLKHARAQFERLVPEPLQDVAARQRPHGLR